MGENKHSNYFLPMPIKTLRHKSFYGIMLGTYEIRKKEMGLNIITSDTTCP